VWVFDVGVRQDSVFRVAAVFPGENLDEDDAS